MSKEYTDKQINSMILFLRVNDIAEMYYLDKSNSHMCPFFDYKSGSYLSKSMVISTAISEGWKENWTTTGENNNER